MKKISQSFLFVLLFFSVSAFSDQAYKVVSPAQPTSNLDKIEVIEFFWYGCPHCYHFEPYVQKWLKSKPENVEFKKVPAIFRPSWSAHARAYYAAKLLGVEPKFTKALFDALHKDRKRIYSQKQIIDFAKSIGINGDDFKDAMGSFAVETKIRRAIQLLKSYAITGVPTIAVNGKYITDATLAKGHENVIKVVNELIAKESKK